MILLNGASVSLSKQIVYDFFYTLKASSSIKFLLDLFINRTLEHSRRYGAVLYQTVAV